MVIKKEKFPQVVFYIDKRIKKKAQKYLQEDGITLSAYVRRCLIKYVNAKENKKEVTNGNI